MTETQNEIVLSASEYILSQSQSETYRLKKGEVQVYIVSMSDGTPDGRKYFCTIKDTDNQRAIPSLAYADATGKSWHILIVTTGEEATLTYTPSAPTSVLFKNFLKRGNITTYEELGFEKSLVAFYEGNSQIVLSSTEHHLSEDPANAYRLERGEVFVYIVPMENGHPGKREFYCEVKASDSQRTIPALVYKDMNHKNWRLQIEPSSEEAVLTRIVDGATSELQKEFLACREITTYEKEGFENSLVEFYTKQIVLKDNAFIEKAEHAETKSQEKVITALGEAFSDDGQTEHTGNDYYQALQFVCKRLDITLVKAEELHTRCGKNPQINDIARASHFICRRVVLDADWYKFDCGGLVSTIDKEIVACVPDKKGKYQLFRSSDGSITPLTPELAKQVSPQSYSIGRTLPLKSLTKKDVFAFCKKSIRASDLTPYIALVILCTLIGVLLPTLNGMIYDDYIPVGNIGNLTQLCLVMLSFMMGNISFSIVKNLFSYRIISRVNIDLQNAVYHRLFHLPESFFRSYDSADLAGRVSGIGKIASDYANTLIVSGISSLFSIFYLIRMFTYNSKLTWLSIAIYAMYLTVIVVITSTSRKGQLRIAEAESEASGKLYQYLNGVDKIRMAGVEDRALLSYMQPYTRQQYEAIRVNRLISVEEALTTVISSVFSMVLYWFIVKKMDPSGFSVGSFVAFNSAFGAFTGALESLVDEALKLFQEKNEMERFWAIFETVPEDDDSKEVPGTLSGSLSLDHVTFAYDKGSKNVLNDLSVDIKNGEYVGIVGPSGCGKSTLLKLLLGFETPQSGMVMVDRKDLRSINKGAYRRQLGVVLQNGKLISGSIYENITITAPDANMARVNDVIQQVGLKDDIAQMPMGLHTMLSENCNTISGGQQQRILIARAICGRPKILIFDEATSALDNMTQAAVSSSLDKMNVTRIVVAHRLSTIKNCDRILVMDGGTIVQEGNYESLMKDKNGLFYALASRQIAE
ncbi:MAG: NHLP bacteriocin export ABC transporter permease/ATPase subunit [Oscillospiraceae bacterium]|nr:NHLP bacteriocin export ABC transporter permease/ATPase subunit [Oscillospiraceae bacterium]